MQHQFFDHLSSIPSPLRDLDPRVKVVALLSLVLVVVLWPRLTSWQVLGYLGLLLALARWARLPLRPLVERSLAVVPFLALVAVAPRGLQLAGPIFARGALSALAMVILTSATPFPELLSALARLGLPRPLVLILSFMYRYTFILVDEAERMYRAWQGRAVSRQRRVLWQSLGGVIASLFLRSYERGERVYAAMAARGFDGEIRLLSPPKGLRGRDLFFLAAFAALLLAITIAWGGN
ncbi:MAG: cobalt ECF transporter T component CbiQ [Bacillota bacterium]|nr:cobalt ECF transporter T component CbiQ [Bacillota bacterium]